MNVKHLSVDVLRGWAERAIPVADQQDRLEVRLLSMYITFSFINDQLGPITYVLKLPPSMLYKVATLAHTSWLVGAMFAVAVVLALPHAIALLAFPRTLAVRWPRKCATLAASIVMVTWGYLAVLAMPVDAGPLFWLYIRQAIDSAGLAFIYAISLNAQLLRALVHKGRSP